VAVRLYFAGNTQEEGADAADYATGVRHRLVSFADVDGLGRKSFAFWIDTRPAGARVFLDSGAFGAYTRGATIELARYCDYVKATMPALAAYAALDVIGDWRATAVNLDHMRKAGLDPLPVFHVSQESHDVLDGILRDGTGQIAIGGMASERATREIIQRELDACWAVIGRHWPVRVHGFGILAQWALERYPFYSVDSSSAIISAGMGRVSRFTGGQFLSDGWREDVRRTLDGVVADGVGHNSNGKSKSAHHGRRRRNIEAIHALQRHVTDLWAAKGVVWEDA
jgi:hypothetical protein